MEMWRRCGEAASVAALYSVYSGLYSEAVVSSMASAVALAEVGQFREAVQYLQRAAKALYEAARDVFEQVKVTAQRLVELFVEAVTRVLAWVDEHKAYLFLMAAVAAGVIALGVALNLWGLVELEKLAYAASLTPFIPAGVKEHSREEAFNILKSDPHPYEKFKKIASEANAGRVKLAEPWESLRKLILPKRSEEEKLIHSKIYSELDEGKKKALFYAALALEEAFSVYRKDVEEREKVVQRVEVGVEPFKKVVYVADLGQIKQLTEEEAAIEKALSTLRKRLNEYAVRHDLGNLLGVNEDVARRLAEAEKTELSEFGGVNFGTKALAALIAYREYALGRRGVFGAAARYWLEVGGSAWLLYHTPSTAHNYAKKAKVERPAAVEEMVAEAFRRLFLKPGADHHSDFVELLGSGKLALELKKEAKSYYVFKLFRLEEGGLRKLGVKLRIKKVREGEGASITYDLALDTRWREFFKQERDAAEKAAKEVRGRLPVEDRFPYTVGWVNSDVAISDGRLVMGTSHLWQLAETHALFDWSDVAVRGVSLTLEGPKPQFHARTSLDELDEVIRRSAEGGWLKMLGIKAESWENLKQRVVDSWSGVVGAAAWRLGEGVRGELEALRNKLSDDKVAREVAAPVLLLIQAERLGVNETTLRYFGAVNSGAIGGDGYVSAARKEVVLTSGVRAVALLWAATLAAYGIKTKVWKASGAYEVVASSEDAVKLAGLYFLFGPPLLEGDERIINHKLAEAVELAAEGLDIRWEGLRRTEGGLVAADLTISVGGAAVKYNIYLLKDTIVLLFCSADRSRVELAVRLMRLAGFGAEVKKEGGRDVWRVVATTDRLAAGREELRKALAEVVKTARSNGWVDAGKAERWLDKLERGRVLKEGWPKYNMRLVEGALVVRFGSSNLDSIAQVAQRFREMGLVEGLHFTVKTPEGGKAGYVSVLKEGLAYAAWLSVYGKDEQQRSLAAAFVEYILQRAEREGKDVYRKALEVVEEGMSRGSQKLEDFEKKVEVNGKTYVVKVKGGEAVEEDRNGKKLLRLKITAEVGRVEGEHIVDRVLREYTITYGRYGDRNAAVGYAYVRADAPGGREADAERLAAVIKALTGREPRIRRMKDDTLIAVCGREHLDGFKHYAELADAIEKWLEETSW